MIHSLATKRIILTLLEAFTQCRAFGELGDEAVREDLMNVVSAYVKALRGSQLMSPGHPVHGPLCSGALAKSS